MHIKILDGPDTLGKEAAAHATNVINTSVQEKGKARIVLSTGASQFEFFKHLTQTNIDWTKVEMFHLDEYVNLPESHPASFRKYLKERFVNVVGIEQAHFVNGEGNISEHIRELTRQIRKEPIDLAIIGIGENAHIAFNDPPADFDTREAFIVVQLDDQCKNQQVGEGWFSDTDSVPDEAITMTVHQIMQSKTIISCVPHDVKAKAVKNTLENDVTNTIPATILKTHPDWTLYLDQGSASLIDGKRYID